jgi:hypothetical protein
MALVLLVSCDSKAPSKAGSTSSQPRTERTLSYQRTGAGMIEDLHLMEKTHIGAPVGDRPWIAQVNLVDLDKDGRMDILSCDSKNNTVFWLRQLDDGSFEEILIAENMRAPVRVEVADMNGNGHWDILVSSMSVVFPNNDLIGAIFILENDGNQQFTSHLIIDNIARVVDVRAADFDGDGLIDLAVAQFGYDQGEVRWMRRVGPWEFESEILLSLSGPTNVCVADFDGNGTLDFAVLVSQQWEEVYVFFNDGRGKFTSKVIWGSTNEDYSLSGMTLTDMNRDGRPDLLFSNGDGFGPNPEPGPKPWHGIQWLENRGNGFFQFRRIGDLGGAYCPIGVDFNGNGLMDVVAVSSFNDWKKPKAESLVWFKNLGGERFEKRVLAYEPIQLLTVDAGRVRGPDGPLALVTGGFHAYPPWGPASRILLWEFNEQP